MLRRKILSLIFILSIISASLNSIVLNFFIFDLAANIYLSISWFFFVMSLYYTYTKYKIYRGVYIELDANKSIFHLNWFQTLWISLTPFFIAKDSLFATSWLLNGMITTISLNILDIILTKEVLKLLPNQEKENV